MSRNLGLRTELTRIVGVERRVSLLERSGGAEFEIKVVADDDTVTTGDGKAIMVIPRSVGGMRLVAAHAFVTTASSSGTPTVQIRNVTTAHDLLSTRITIDTSEFTSYTAATQPVINSTYDEVSTGDLIAVDIDVAGTGAQGLGVVLTWA